VHRLKFAVLYCMRERPSKRSVGGNASNKIGSFARSHAGHDYGEQNRCEKQDVIVHDTFKLPSNAAAAACSPYSAPPSVLSTRSMRTRTHPFAPPAVETAHMYSGIEF